MRKLMSFSLILFLMRPLLATGAPDIIAQINSIPSGAPIEVQLQNKQKLRGARGAASEMSFVLIENGSGERQIAFADVVSIKRIKKSHTTRNVLIIVGVAVAAVVIAGVVLWENRGPYVKL